jgi:hypothetical protein
MAATKLFPSKSTMQICLDPRCRLFWRYAFVGPFDEDDEVRHKNIARPI